MATTMLRGVFDSHSAANQAASRLRASGLHKVQVQSEPRPVIQRASETAPVLLFSVLIGAVIGGFVGLLSGFPFIALPSIRNDVATIILTVVAWVGGGVLFGMLCGAIFGGIFGSAFRGKGKAKAAPTSAPVDHEQAVVLVSVEDESAVEQTHQLLRDLSAQTVETYEGELTQ